MKLLDYIEKQLTWDVVCRLLRMQPKLIPTITRCPVCVTSSLRVCINSNRPVIHMSCSHCKRSGGPLWWLNTIWNNSLITTLNRLQAEQLRIPQKAYTPEFYLQWEKLLRIRNAGTVFWDKQVMQSWNRLYALKNQFPIYVNRHTRGQTLDRWTTKLNRLVGVLTQPELNKIQRINPEFVTEPIPALTVPFYCNHRQICGLYGITKSKQDPQGQYYRFSGHRQEAGLAWLDTALDWPASQSILVTKNPIMGLKIHLKMASIGHVGAPLVAAMFDGSEQTTTDMWLTLQDRDLVFWVDELDAATIEHAVLTNARIRCAKMSETLNSSGFQETWAESNPGARLATVAKTAIKAVTAVEYFLSRSADMQIAQVAQDLSTKPKVLDMLLSRLKKPQQSKLRRFLPSKYRVNNFRISTTQEVVEIDNQWFVDTPNSRVQLSDFIVKLKRFIDSGDDFSLYEGEIHYRDNVIPFREKTSIIENQLVLFVKDQLIEHGLGITTTSTTRSRQLYTIALKFCNPELVKIPRHVGWHADQQALVFPQFKIDRGGVVDTLFKLPTTDDCPALNFQPSSAAFTTVLVKNYLRDMSYAEIDLMALIADYVLGAFNSQTPRPTCLIYDQCGLAWDKLLGLGCSVGQPSRHQYPSLQKVGAFFEKFIDRTDSTVLTGCPLLPSLIAGIQGRCNVLSLLSNRQEFESTRLQMCRDVLVQFFQHTLRQPEILYKTISDYFVSWVCNDMGVTFKSGLYHREGIDGRLNMVRLLIDYRTTKKASIVSTARSGAESIRNSILISHPTNPDAILLNVIALLKDLHSNSAYQLHPDQIVRLVENSKIFHGRYAIDGVNYLAIDRTWPFQDNTLFANKPNLRIIG